MKVLVVGQGGREHALAWKIKQSPLVTKIYVSPGNAGTSLLGENIKFVDNYYQELLNWAIQKEIDLTVIGPEQPLVEGLVDMFLAEGLLVFGPTGAAAALEGSKIFAKELMMEANVPTAAFLATDDINEVKKYLGSSGGPYVIKADGLAAGKGVIICQTSAEALKVATGLLQKGQLGQAGKRIVLEEYLVGNEVSILVLVDGKNHILLTPSRDHKKVGEGDTGPNTGGMGAYSPVPDVGEDILAQIDETIVGPVLKMLHKRGIEYRGILYVGLILTKEGPRVLEFNVRFGDPETQVVLPRLKSDLVPYLLGAARGRLPAEPLQWLSDTCLGVVLASGGYPGEYQRGYPISGLDDLSPAVNVFQAGTQRKDNLIVTSGGRVLCLVGMGKDREEAGKLVYREIKKIKFKDCFYRRDIGKGEGQ